MTKLTVVTYEPETIGVYIDGELHKRGESYMEARIMRDIMVSDINVTETETMWFGPERWEGMPDTIEEAEELYGDE